MQAEAAAVIRGNRVSVRLVGVFRLIGAAAGAGRARVELRCRLDLNAVGGPLVLDRGSRGNRQSVSVSFSEADGIVLPCGARAGRRLAHGQRRSLFRAEFPCVGRSILRIGPPRGEHDDHSGKESCWAAAHIRKSIKKEGRESVPRHRRHSASFGGSVRVKRGAKMAQMRRHGTGRFLARTPHSDPHWRTAKHVLLYVATRKQI